MFVSEEVIYCPSEKVRDFDLRNENKIYGKNNYLFIIHEDGKRNLCLSCYYI